jgi:hypothetical protein
MFNKFILVLLTILLTACTSYHDLKAPCTYDHRMGCGSVIPLQQTTINPGMNN